VTHSKDEHVRGTIHTNTVEGFYSIFKRGMKGVYQHCAAIWQSSISGIRTASPWALMTALAPLSR
jgi:hypothetical protein